MHRQGDERSHDTAGRPGRLPVLRIEEDETENVEGLLGNVNAHPEALVPVALLVLLEGRGTQVEGRGVGLQVIGELPQVEAAAEIPDGHHQLAVGGRHVDADVPRLVLLAMGADGVVEKLQNGETDVLVAYPGRRNADLPEDPDDLPEIRVRAHRQPDRPALFAVHVERGPRIHFTVPFPIEADLG